LKQSDRGLPGKRRGGDGFDEELGNFFGGCGVDFAIDADDSSEGGDGIAGERFLICLKN